MGIGSFLGTYGTVDNEEGGRLRPLFAPPPPFGLPLPPPPFGLPFVAPPLAFPPLEDVPFFLPPLVLPCTIFLDCVTLEVVLEPSFVILDGLVIPADLDKDLELPDVAVKGEIFCLLEGGSLSLYSGGVLSPKEVVLFLLFLFLLFFLLWLRLPFELFEPLESLE